MEWIETRTGLAIIFILAVALFFLHKHARSPFKDLLAKASAGDAKAQYQLGLFYYRGKHVPQDYAQALNWFDTAAKNGSIPAMNALAGLYNAGHGCDPTRKRLFTGTKWPPP